MSVSLHKLSLQLQVRSYVVSSKSIYTHRQRTVDNDLVRILWFGFLVQTFVNFRVFGVLIGLVTVYEYGMQISILGSLATGFAVLGVDRNIYSDASAQQATGAGWLIVAIVLAVGLLVVVVARRRSRRAPDGIENFRRHMDALSSDSRRGVTDRVRHARDGRKG